MTKDDFLHVLQSDFVEMKMFELSIEDVVKPMVTLAKRYSKNLGDLFDKIDTSRDGLVSAEELAEHLKRQIAVTLRPDDVQMIKQYFKAKNRSDKINRTGFIELFNRDFERNFSEQAAKKALGDVKNRIDEMKLDRSRLQELVQKFNDK